MINETARPLRRVRRPGDRASGNEPKTTSGTRKPLKSTGTHMRTRLLFSAVLAGGLLPLAAASVPSAASAASGDPGHLGTAAIVAWNVESLKVTLGEPPNPPLEGRNIAIESAAVYDAVTSIIPRFDPYAVRLTVTRPASAAAAADAAAHAVMTALYPDQQASLDAFEATQLAMIPDGTAKDNGLAVGTAAASAILALRANDHSGDSVSYTPGTAPGQWQPTPPAFKSALEPGWGNVTPFVLQSGNQFLPGPPPALDSATYAADFNEIKAIGSADSTTRTPEQTTIAELWSVTGSQLWNQAIQQIAISRGLSPAVTARDFAMLDLAGADSFIESWGTKYIYNQWRPITAIREADTDGNAATVADPSWTPLLTTPNFPDYIAGHTTYAGTAEVILTSLLGAHPGTFTFTNHANGLSWTYDNFAQAAIQVVNARVWGGIHFRTSCTTGRQVGNQVGAYALTHILQPAD